MRRYAIIIMILLLLVPAAGLSAEGAAPQDKIQLAFAGDILLDGFVGEQIAKYGVNFPFVKVAPVLQKADLAFANLETPVSVRETPPRKCLPSAPSRQHWPD